MPSEDAQEATQPEDETPEIEAGDAAAPDAAVEVEEAVEAAGVAEVSEAEPVEPIGEAEEGEAEGGEAEGGEAEDGEAEGDEAEDGEAEGGEAVADGDQLVEIGGTIFVTVQRITPYGAFVELPDKRTGLIHISEIDRNYVKDVREHLREGDRVEAKVSAIKEDGKIDLSIKALQDPQPRMARGSNPEFEQMLRKFMRSSEERQVDVKRSTMHKRK